MNSSPYSSVEMDAASERSALLSSAAGRRRADRALVAGCLLATLGVIAAGKRDARAPPGAALSEPDRTVRPSLPRAGGNVTRALPTLGINGSLVSVSGLSSGADMAVQFHVAHSSRVMGAAIFAGEPYHCALTLFSAEMARGIAEPPPYDHCKSTPEVVEPEVLVKYTRRRANESRIDDPDAHLRGARVYLYRGRDDATYLNGSVTKTKRYYEAWGMPAAHVKFETSVPSDHAIPTIAYGGECGSGDPTSPLENCRYDGAGEALRHIYGTTREDAFMRLPSSAEPADLRVFNQTPFAVAGSGLADEGYVYVPPRCARAGGCALHIFLHGCFGCVTCADGPNTTLVTHAGFNRWAALNAAVILYPQLKNIETSCWSAAGCGVGESKQQSWGCWDSYGYGGADYDLQDGAQIRALIAMVDHLTHPVAVE